MESNRYRLVSDTVQSRRRIIELIYLYGALIIAEGALRKWFLPMLQKPLYFMKDPILIVAYIVASRSNLWPTHKLFKTAVIIAICTIFWGVVQIPLGPTSFLTSLLGWRNYCGMLPFTFLIERWLNGRDLFKILRYILLTSIPMAVLVFIQYRSPPGAPVNKLLDEGSLSYQYAGMVRVNGTFSFTQGHELYCHVIFAVLLCCWLLPNSQRPVKGKTLWCACCATVVNILLDGNRAVFSNCASTWLASLVYRIFMRPKRLKLKFHLLFLPEVLIAVGLAVYVGLFPDAFRAMAERMEEPEGKKGDQARRFASAITLLQPALVNLTVFGKGMGLGTAAGRLLAPKYAPYIGEETDLPKCIEECGVLGLALVAYRITLTVWIIRRAFIACKRSENPTPLLLATVPCHAFIWGQVWLNGTGNNMIYFCAGLAMAANRLGEKR